MLSVTDEPAPPPSASTGSRRSRGGPRALAVGLVVALVGIVGYVLIVDSGGSSSPDAASAPASTTTVAEATAVEVYNTLIPSLVLVTAGSDDVGSIGSGVVVSEAALVLTANHVLRGQEVVEVAFSDGTRTSATVVNADPENDLAVLAPNELPEVVVPAVLGGGVRVGDAVFPLGNPFGFTGTLTAGVVSGLGRKIGRGDGPGELVGLIQFDAAVNPGSSGGPLVDSTGQVVGIVTALANPTSARTFAGLGFAVPIATASEAVGTIER